MRPHIRSAISFPLLSLLACTGQASAACRSDRVELETDAGAIVVQVHADKAPASAGDFLKYVDEGRYRGGGFYRVVRQDNDNGAPKIDVIQGGLLDSGDMPGIPHESTEMTGLRHDDGALSLARNAPGTGGAGAFFISIGDQPALDHGQGRNPDRQGFAVFGHVIRGMDVVRRIHAVPADALGGEDYVKGQILKQPILIRDARRVCD